MVPSTKTTFVSSCTNSVVILRYETICRAHMETVLFGDNLPYGVFSHDVTAAILVSQNNETAAMLVSQTNLLGVELFTGAFPLSGLPSY